MRDRQHEWGRGGARAAAGVGTHCAPALVEPSIILRFCWTSYTRMKPRDVPIAIRSCTQITVGTPVVIDSIYTLDIILVSCDIHVPVAGGHAAGSVGAQAGARRQAAVRRAARHASASATRAALPGAVGRQRKRRGARGAGRSGSAATRPSSTVSASRWVAGLAMCCESRESRRLRMTLPWRSRRLRHVPRARAQRPVSVHAQQCAATGHWVGAIAPRRICVWGAWRRRQSGVSLRCR